MGSLLVRPIVIPDLNTTPRVEGKLTGSDLTHSVEIEISNHTRNITLKYPRTYLYWGQCSVSPKSELSPGSSGTCHFSGSYPMEQGVAGILVYTAESFTLVIHFYNPIDYNRFYMRLGLELSPGKAYLKNLEDTYTRMANRTGSSSCPDIKFDCGFVKTSHRTVQVSHGPIKVTAIMFGVIDSHLRVVLEEEE